MAFTTRRSSLLLALLAVAPAAAEYWTDKAKLAFATRFSVEYHSSPQVEDPYKFVRFRQDTGDTAHVLYLKGAVQPSLATVAAKHGIAESALTAIAIPVEKTAITTTLLTPYLEVLGETATLKYTRGADLTGPYRIASACVNKMYSEGLVEPTANNAALDALDMDVVFSGTCPTSWSTCPARSAIFSYENELTMASWGDYIQLAGVYFNKEERGFALSQKIHANFECVKNTMADAVVNSGVTKPKVLWAYQYFGTWYATLSESTYQGEVTTAAGGIMMGQGFLGSAAVLNSYGGMTSADFTTFAKDADVLIYASNYSAAYSDPSMRAVIEQLDAFTNKRIYDIYQDGNQWFERRIIQPDMLAEDMLKIIHPSLAKNATDLYFLRDVFTQPDPGKEALFPDPASCTDYSAVVDLPTSDLCPKEPAPEVKVEKKEKKAFFDSGANVALVCVLCAMGGMVIASMAMCYMQKGLSAAPPAPTSPSTTVKASV